MYTSRRTRVTRGACQIIAGAVVLSTPCFAMSGQQPSFTGLGDLPGGTVTLQPSAIGRGTEC